MCRPGRAAVGIAAVVFFLSAAGADSTERVHFEVSPGAVLFAGWDPLLGPSGPRYVKLYAADGTQEAAFPCTDPATPFDPNSLEAPGADIMVWNPAFLGSEAFPDLQVNGVGADEEVFMRQWYAPGRTMPRGNVWTPVKPQECAALVTEYTFLLRTVQGSPASAQPGSRFYFPTAWSSQADNAQVGLERFPTAGAGELKTVLLSGIRAQERCVDLCGPPVWLEEGQCVQFVDHEVEVTAIGCAETSCFIAATIYYPQEFNGQVRTADVILWEFESLVAGRHLVRVASGTDEAVPVDMPWHLEALAVDVRSTPARCLVQAGRLVQEGETFFADGAACDVVKIHLVSGRDGPGLQYITVRVPRPLDTDVSLAELAVSLRGLLPHEPVALLPPFNTVHEVRDIVNPTGDGRAVFEPRWLVYAQQGKNTCWGPRLMDLPQGAEMVSRDLVPGPRVFAGLYLPPVFMLHDLAYQDFLLVPSLVAPLSRSARIAFTITPENHGGLYSTPYGSEAFFQMNLFGSAHSGAAFPYTDPDAPFDPDSPETPRSDMLTWNPAFLRGEDFPELQANGLDADEQIFLRQWYEPENTVPAGENPVPVQPFQSTALATEYTWMLRTPAGAPATAGPGSTFLFPTAWAGAAGNAQPGLEDIDVDSDGIRDSVVLRGIDAAEKTVDLGSGLLRLGRGQSLQFIDHRAEIVDIQSTGNDVVVMVRIAFPAAFDEEDFPDSDEVVLLRAGDCLAASRFDTRDGDPVPMVRPWYFEVAAIDMTDGPPACVVRAGRLLQTGESFFCDGAEYAVGALHMVTDNDTDTTQLRHITLRTYLPLGHRDVAIPELAVIVQAITAGAPVPMLPPFNAEHGIRPIVSQSRLPDGLEPVRAAPVTVCWRAAGTFQNLTFRVCDMPQEDTAFTCLDFSTRPDGYLQLELPVLAAPGSVPWGQYLLSSSWATVADPAPDRDADLVPDSRDNCPDVYNPDQRDSDTLGGGDVCDPCPADATDSCNTSGSGAIVAGGAAGDGELTTADGKTSIVVPSAAVAKETSFSITDDGGGYVLATERGRVRVLFGVTLMPEGTAFAQPVTVVFRWEDDGHGRVAGTNIREKDLMILRNAEPITSPCTTSPCQPGGVCSACGCDMDADEFTLQLTGFSRYVFGGALDSDGDGVPDDYGGEADACPGSDTEETIMIAGCDTGVPNPVDNTGCSRADLLAPCAGRAENHGEYVRCVSHLTHEWMRAGLISGRERGSIQKCAARAPIP